MSRLIYGWLTSLVAGMPLGLGYFLADALTEVHFRLFPARRHAALANLAVILPRADRRERMRIARGMMRSYNRMMFEFFRLPHMTRAELLRAVEFQGREHLEQAVARGRGVIITSCHVGNWELAGVTVAHTSERHIREHLDQWCIFRPLWEGAPATAAEGHASHGASAVRRIEA